jgi:hypothetical protein
MKRAGSHVLVFLCLFVLSDISAQQRPGFAVLGFFTAKQDLAHISFLHEANPWLQKMATEHGFRYDSTNDWNKLNHDTLSKYDVVLFLDTRPKEPEQRKAFREYMEHGGAWIGFHFAAFALTPSDYNQDWDWYHQTFLGAGQYKSNTWRPTPAVLRVEKPESPFLKNIPAKFSAAANEWYRWEKDLRKNPDIDVLLSIDSSSFPLGTGPKPHEIWHSGDYPVVWANKKFRMVYFNMGHNDMDYEGGTNRALSSSFSSVEQNRLLLNALLWLGNKK